MYNSLSRTILLAALMTSFSSIGHTSDFNSLGVFDDWGAFSSANPQECWAVSAGAQEKAKHYRNGQEVKGVNRGDGTQLYATFVKTSDKLSSWLAFTGGEYQFSEQQPVTLEVDGKQFKLFIANDADRGWAYTSGTIDAQIIELFKAGAIAKLTSVSSRGTQSVDEISLIGFTAAFEAARKACT